MARCRRERVGRRWTGSCEQLAARVAAVDRVMLVLVLVLVLVWCWSGAGKSLGGRVAPATAPPPGLSRRRWGSSGVHRRPSTPVRHITSAASPPRRPNCTLTAGAPQDRWLYRATILGRLKPPPSRREHAPLISPPAPGTPSDPRGPPPTGHSRQPHVLTASCAVPVLSPPSSPGLPPPPPPLPNGVHPNRTPHHHRPIETCFFCPLHLLHSQPAPVSAALHLKPIAYRDPHPHLPCSP
ncbi:hypothetical protein BU26DRAFT_124870 [Trematosphaeria pertusa]|uniref:Uncharacterized protein n=1 Tax=Trematosphaeria pertusa TaxID=390896 RepID=A0A6A6HYC8_9PLEO|nr:uncharacterized protein BU26DRAFT_124870 [Trematosphaeria pertusa]KAF2243027.1 hypothetical protein BU26DRAFT_124870 [Trematosphaeria pertusa]